MGDGSGSVGGVDVAESGALDDPKPLWSLEGAVPLGSEGNRKQREDGYRFLSNRKRNQVTCAQRHKKNVATVYFE